MSRRTSIVKALADKLKAIDGSGNYLSNVYGNAHAKLKYWDEVQDFPCVYVVAGPETREYLPSDFTWVYLNVSLKVYVKGEDAQQLLEELLEDVESVIDANRVLEYDAVNNYRTTEILITSITTDEGLLAPFGVADVNLQVRTPKM